MKLRLLCITDPGILFDRMFRTYFRARTVQSLSAVSSHTTVIGM